MLLRKGVYPYEYLVSWQRFDETSLPDKEAFYSNLNMEGITDVDYRHGKTVFEYLIKNNLGDYHYLYVQNDTLLLADVFENFINMCIKVYELDPAHFLSAPGLAWQACLKKTEVKLELLTGVDMLLMVEKEIRGGVCHAIYRYAKANIKYMKNYNKDKEESFLQYLDDNNLEAWLKPYIDMNTELRKKAKNDFEKDFFKLMNNAVFGKAMENVRKHRDIKLVTTDKRRIQSLITIQRKGFQKNY